MKLINKYISKVWEMILNEKPGSFKARKYTSASIFFVIGLVLGLLF